MSRPDRPKNKTPGREAKGFVSRTSFPAQGLDGRNGTQGRRAAQLLVGVSRSTSSAAQRDRIIKALRTGPKTSYDLRRLGCYQAPARIKELRDKFGYTISTQRVTLWDRDGWPHRGAALYTLLAEPEVVADLEDAQ